MIKELKINIENKKNYNVMIEKYNSAMDIVADCKKRNLTSSRFDNAKYFDDWHWRGCKNYEEALDLLKNGYIDKVEQIKSKIEKSINGTNKRITFKNDIVGYAPVVPLAILGVPNSMINSTMKPIKAKVLDLYYDMTCNCGTSSEKIIKCGIEFLQTIVSLEMQGYRINLKAVQTYSDERSCDILKLNIKNANQPLDLKRISFPTIHTAFFRVIGFDWYSKTPKGTYRGGYGTSLDRIFKGDNLQKFYTQVFGKNAIYVSASKIIHKEAKSIEEMIKNESIKSNKS